MESEATFQQRHLKRTDGIRRISDERARNKQNFSTGNFAVVAGRLPKRLTYFKNNDTL